MQRELQLDERQVQIARKACEQMSQALLELKAERDMLMSCLPHCHATSLGRPEARAQVAPDPIHGIAEIWKCCFGDHLADLYLVILHVWC